MSNKKLIVNLDAVIQDKADEFKTPYIVFDDLVTLFECAIRAYGVNKYQTKLSFDTLCYYCIKYISTPFGKRVLLELANKVNFYN